MAKASGHKWGQSIGDVVELATRDILEDVAKRHGCYLDSPGSRNARNGKKVAWTDRFGNKHDLDYVIERGGTDDTLGTPAAFIEVAWRRYTKHSRNKAQEIEGAVLPLAATFEHEHPFLGAVIAGVFTHGARTQLESKAFRLLYISYESVLSAFAAVGIDAAFDEETPEEEFDEKVKAWGKLSKEDQGAVARRLLEIEGEQVQRFIAALDESLSRRVRGVVVGILRGAKAQLATAEEAIAYIEGHADNPPSDPTLFRFEVGIRYSNGDSIDASFGEKVEAIAFLRRYA